MPDRHGVPFVLRVNGRCGELRALVDELAAVAEGADKGEGLS